MKQNPAQCRSVVAFVALCAAAALAGCMRETSAPQQGSQPASSPATAGYQQAAPPPAAQQPSSPGYGQPGTAGAAPAPSSSDFKTLEQAEVALAAANEELARLFPAEQKRKRSAAPAKATEGAQEAEASADRTDPCAQACRAFSSLKRAADAVCRLAGDPSAPCSRAKSLVTDNERRVTTCPCTEPPKP